MLHLFENIFNSLTLSVIDRLEAVRKKRGLNKSQFERSLGVSTGYLKLTEKRQSHPGTDVLIEFSKKYSDICLKWLLTGEGEMLKENEDFEKKGNRVEDENPGYPDLMTVRNEIRGDLKGLMDGMTENFSTLHRGVTQVLKDTQRINDVIDDLGLAKLKNAGKGLKELLEGK